MLNNYTAIIKFLKNKKEDKVDKDVAQAIGKYKIIMITPIIIIDKFNIGLNLVILMINITDNI